MRLRAKRCGPMLRGVSVLEWNLSVHSVLEARLLQMIMCLWRR